MRLCPGPKVSGFPEHQGLPRAPELGKPCKASNLGILGYACMYLTIFFPTFFTDCIMSILLRGSILHTPTTCVCVLWWYEWAALSWPQAPLTCVVAFPSLSRRVCHLLPPGCQHLPRPLRPHTHFCSSCAWRVFRDTARCPLCRWEIEEVAPAGDPLVLGAGEGLLV